jgi:hypothetical protein
MYPALVDSVKEMIAPSFEKFFQGDKIDEWRRIFMMYSISRISISAVIAYVAGVLYR